MADPRFVIQQHAASTLHYDFRLEVDGVLRSWAVPRGPSTDPADKRLAVEVEDHSIAYGDFEGRIGRGYGRGSVIVWDNGTYRPLDDIPMAEALERGRASFWLQGRKLRGGWTLLRTDDGAKPKWLLIKRRDEEAGPDGRIVHAKPRSVVSGRRIDEL
jgi:DNA ligase D-like protein (predicted 3'-phosphoesterase)